MTTSSAFGNGPPPGASGCPFWLASADSQRQADQALYPDVRRRDPPKLLSKIEAVEDDTEAVRQIGVYHAAQQCEALLRDGVAGLHFYTLNRSTATRAIYQHIKSSLQREDGAEADNQLSLAFEKR